MLDSQATSMSQMAIIKNNRTVFKNLVKLVQVSNSPILLSNVYCHHKHSDELTQIPHRQLHRDSQMNLMTSLEQ